MREGGRFGGGNVLFASRDLFYSKKNELRSSAARKETVFSELDRKPGEPREDCKAAVSEDDRVPTVQWGQAAEGQRKRREVGVVTLRAWVSHSREPPSPPT